MRTRKAGLSAVVVCVALSLGACGRRSAPPQSVPSQIETADPVESASDPSRAEPKGDPGGMLDTGLGTASQGASSEDSNAGSEPAGPTVDSSGVPLGEPKDECTPVSVEFERRARPELKACYREGKKKAPNLEGTVKIKIFVNVKGKIQSTKVIEKTLPDSVSNCMLAAVKATPFPEVEKCYGASIIIPVTFPTPR